MRTVLVLLVALLSLPAAAIAYTADDAPIVTNDITNFWSAYDKLASANTEADSLRALFEHYYLPASPGLRLFIRARIGSVYDLLDVIRARPGYFASMRASTERVLELEPAIRRAFRKWARLVPDAEFPGVTFVIGRMSSGGTTHRSHILIGVDMYGRTSNTPEAELDDWLRDVLKPVDGLPAIVAHELIHTQQRYAEDHSLLAACIKEGIGDFLGEMISGQNINAHVHEWAAPREEELWEDFQTVMMGTDRDGWLYARRAEDEPNDLGYWMGYRIAEAYYNHTDDHSAAIRDMLTIQDFPAFLEQSGYGR